MLLKKKEIPRKTTQKADITAKETQYEHQKYHRKLLRRRMHSHVSGIDSKINQGLLFLLMLSAFMCFKNID